MSSKKSIQAASDSLELFHGHPLRRSTRRRHIAVIVEPSGAVELRVPTAAGAETLERAWLRLGPWLERKLAQLRNHPPATVHRFDFTPGNIFFYRGEPVTLIWREAPYGSMLIRYEAGLLLTPGREPAVIQRALEAFYRRQARRIIAGKLEQFGRQFGIDYGAITINGARKRFGSCNAGGDLNFSWHLAMYPEPLIDLVILHELAHRSEMNHSAAFYRVLGGYLPDHRQRNRELRRWSRKLSAYPE